MTKQINIYNGRNVIIQKDQAGQREETYIRGIRPNSQQCQQSCALDSFNQYKGKYKLFKTIIEIDVPLGGELD